MIDKLNEAAEKYADGPDCSWVGTSALEQAFKAGAEWAREQMPLPEDTLIFKKGVEEGKRLMMEVTESGKELLYVCDKSYKIGYRDGKRDAEQKQKGGKK